MNTSQLVNQIQRDGYAFVPDLISPDECEKFKVLLEKNYEDYAGLYCDADASAGEQADKTGEKVVFNLHNKSIEWFHLFENPQVLAILDIILKEGGYNEDEPYYLNNISARSPLKGHPGQQLHLDSRLPGVNYCISVNVIWMLDDFTLENGATRVVPGSHNWKGYASDGLIHPDEVRVTGKKGGALIFNANLWHGGAQNITDGTRWGVALGYSRWFVKPSFDFMQNTPKHIFEALTEQQRLS